MLLPTEQNRHCRIAMNACSTSASFEMNSPRELRGLRCYAVVLTVLFIDPREGYREVSRIGQYGE